MKYGILFGTVSVLLIFLAVIYRGLCFLCLWPAISFAMIASGYLFFGPKVYGKSSKGRLSLFNVFLLLPYLLYMWSVWFLIRLVKTEPAYDQLTDRIFIGRRLLQNEFPDKFDHVIDLTCEFSEPKAARNVNYHSFQILDGFVPDATQLAEWSKAAAEFGGTIYIHCAEGHGRTGLFATVLLMQLEVFSDVNEALDFVKSKRPLVRLGSRQLQGLEMFQKASRK